MSLRKRGSRIATRGCIDGVLPCLVESAGKASATHSMLPMLVMLSMLWIEHFVRCLCPKRVRQRCGGNKMETKKRRTSLQRVSTIEMFGLGADIVMERWKQVEDPRDLLAGVDRAPRTGLQALGPLGLLGVARAVFPVPAGAWPAWLCNATRLFQSCAMAFDKRREKTKPRGRQWSPAPKRCQRPETMWTAISQNHFCALLCLAVLLSIVCSARRLAWSPP